MANYNPTPREAFCSNAQNVTEHHVLVENEIIRKSIDTTLAEFCRRITSVQIGDAGSGCMNLMRIQGAQEFVHLFYNLCETQPIPASKDDFNLPSNVKPLPKK